MTISSSKTADGSALTISVAGRFDFSSHHAFREAYENLSEKPGRYVIDMAEATYLDSSALGMLLLLRDYAGGDSANIAIVHCNHDVKKILTISNFEKLFAIS